MRRPVAALLSAALLATGCASAPPRYAKPDSTAAKAGEELQSCRADSNEAMTEGAKDAARQRRDQAEIIDQCMQAKGYSRSGTP